MQCNSQNYSLSVSGVLSIPYLAGSAVLHHRFPSMHLKKWYMYIHKTQFSTMCMGGKVFKTQHLQQFVFSAGVIGDANLNLTFSGKSSPWHTTVSCTFTAECLYHRGEPEMRAPTWNLKAVMEAQLTSHLSSDWPRRKESSAKEKRINKSCSQWQPSSNCDGFFDFRFFSFFKRY